MANGLQRKTFHGKTKSKMRPQTYRFVGGNNRKRLLICVKTNYHF